jgi:hypothetical protein
VVWASPPAAFEDGKLMLDLTVPADCPEGASRLRVYAWDPQGGEDVALDAEVRVLIPQLDLADLRVEGGEKGASCQVICAVDNPLPVSATACLTVYFEDAATSRVLRTSDLTLDALSGETVTLELEPGAARSAGVILASLTNAREPADPARAKEQLRWRPVPGADRAPCWLPSRCELQTGAPMALLRAAARADAAGGEYLAGLDLPDGRTLTTQTLTLGAASGPQPLVFDFRLSGIALEQLSAATLWLARRGTPGATTANSRLAAMPAAGIRRSSPHLRLVAGSLRARPERPSDGDTIFINARVENAGPIPSLATEAALYDNPPSEGGHPLAEQMRRGASSIPALAPGRSMPVTLRWDPLGNAGARSVWVCLKEGVGVRAAPTSDTQLAIQVTALSKASLSVGRVWAEVSERDRRYHRVRLKAEVRNQGETDARRVMVSFYRSRLQTPENKLGELELERVPGLGSADAEYLWDYDPAKDMPEGGQMPAPTVQLWLKGSSQRVSSNTETGDPEKETGAAD